MKNKSAVLSAAAVLSLSVLLGGVGTSLAASAAHRTSPQYGGTFINTVPTAWQPDLMPLLASSAYSQAIWTNQFLNLIGMNPQGTLSKVNGVVDRWSLGRDQKTYTFWINPKVKWNNGMNVTSQDVELGVDWLASKSYNGALGGYYGYMAQSIQGAANPLPDGKTPSGFKIISPEEFQITLYHRDPAVINSQLSSIVALPYFKLGKIPMSTWNKIPFDTVPTIGDGPWVTSSVVQGETVVQTANKYFAWGRPYIPTYEWEVVKPDLVSGDLAKGLVTASPLEAKYVAGLKRYPNVKFNITTGNGYDYLAWRLNNSVYGKEFRNVNFRQAVQYAINRPAFIRAFDKGYGTPQNGPLPDVSPWYDQSIKNAYPYNPTLANKLLDQAGFRIGQDGWRMTPEGKPFTPTITYTTGDPTIAQEAQAIQQFIQAIHINVKVNPPIDFNTLLNQQNNDTNGKQPVQGFLEGIGFTGVPDPDPRGTWRTTDQYNLDTWDWSYKDKWTALNDQLIAEQASPAAFNYVYRKNIIDQWQELYNQRLPMGNFLDDPSTITAYQSNLRNVYINALGWFYPWKMYFSNN